MKFAVRRGPESQARELPRGKQMQETDAGNTKKEAKNTPILFSRLRAKPNPPHQKKILISHSTRVE